MKGQRTQDEQRVCVRKHYSEFTNFGRGNKISLKTWLFVEKQQSKLTRFCPCEESEVLYQLSPAPFARTVFTPHVAGLLTALFPRMQVYTSNHPAIMRWGIVCNGHC